MVRLPSLCLDQLKAKVLKPVAEGCRLTGPTELRCEAKRMLTRVLPPSPGLWGCFTHRDCTHNEIVAIRNRVVGEVPTPTQKGLLGMQVEAKRLIRELPNTARLSYDEFVEHYSGKRRNRYQSAVDSLIAQPLEIAKESDIKAFVKAEKFNPAAKVNPDPRVIQARHPRYNVELGRYLKPIEKQLYGLRSDKGFPLLGKGLSMQKRGSVLYKIWQTFRNPVCVSLDASRFDQHVDASALSIEHFIYKCLNEEEYLASLLKRQIHNKCVTNTGVKYRTKGKRMSGDMNTALGNCLLMIMMVRAYLKDVGIEGDIFDDGDDVLVIIEAENLPKLLATVEEGFLEFGHEIKVENIAARIEDVNWCQSKPVINHEGRYRMVADWKKVLAQSTSGVQHWHEPTTRVDVAFSVGQCLLALYPGVPIISAYARALCKSGAMSKGIYDTDWLHKIQGTSVKLGELQYHAPTIEERTSFFKAWGVDEIDQLTIEAQLWDWQVPTSNVVVTDDVGVDRDWNWHDHHLQPVTSTAWDWLNPHPQ